VSEGGDRAARSGEGKARGGSRQGCVREGGREMRDER
jgi:hypothetical protein